MAHPFGSNWPTVGKLIELFTAMGCELGELPGEIEGPEGPYRVRFLYSPATDDFVSLSNYEDDERIPPSELASWQRRLGTEIPWDPAWD